MGSGIKRVEVVCYEDDKVVSTIIGKHIFGVVLTGSDKWEVAVSGIRYGILNTVESLGEIEALEGLIKEERSDPMVNMLSLLSDGGSEVRCQARGNIQDYSDVVVVKDENK